MSARRFVVITRFVRVAFGKTNRASSPGTPARSGRTDVLRSRQNRPEQDQGEHLADAGDGLQAVEGLHIVHFGGPAQVQFEGGDVLVEAVDDGEVTAGYDGIRG